MRTGKGVVGKYTVYDNSAVDAAVEQDLREIIARIVEELPVISIVLIGGFGRGEGGVLLSSDGVQPVNDYDLLLVVEDGFCADLGILSRELAGIVNIRLIDLIPRQNSLLATLPATQFNFDFKYGGMVLWGANVLDRIPAYRPEEVLPESGKSLLLNRLVCAIECYSKDFERHGVAGEAAFFLVNQTSKVILACVEALLIKAGSYHHSYQKRQEIFSIEFPEKKALQALVQTATDFKLRPSEKITFDPVVYWQEAMCQYLEVMADYFEFMGILPDKNLWAFLNQPSVADEAAIKPIERVELMLLLYREASYFRKRRIAARTFRELTTISSAGLQGKNWEAMRAHTAALWHRLCH